jgi:hypothetical protein
MAIQTLAFDPAAEAMIARIMQAFHVQTTGDVISRALALAEEARKSAGDGGVVILSGQGPSAKIDLTR